MGAAVAGGISRPSPPTSTAASDTDNARRLFRWMFMCYLLTGGALIDPPADMV